MQTFMKRKIAFVNGTRADFGLMLPILKGIQKSKKLQLQTYAGGMHLMPEFGETIKLVKKQFPKTKIFEVIFKDDERPSMSNYIGELIIQITKEFSRNRPDIMLVVGDRIEMLASTIASLYLGIPVAHVHGGDKSGTVDDSARHAITKIAHIHFAPSKIALKRIKNMGEEEWRIHLVGAPSLDTILNYNLPTRKELCRKLKLPYADKIILVTQHSVSEEIEDAESQMKETLKAVKRFNLPTVVIYSNADPGGRRMIKIIKKEAKGLLFRVFPNLEYHTFLALEREASVWVGNSSAQVIDSTSFHTPVVLIGPRQLGRLRGKNVIDVDYREKEIYEAMKKSLFDKKYIDAVKGYKSPWGDGKAAPKIIKVLENIKLDKELMMKKFVL